MTVRRTNGRTFPHVIVVGGGVAALEALLALHEHAGRRIKLTLLAAGSEFLNRPASVAEPFGMGGPGPIPFTAVARYCDAEVHAGMLSAVDVEDQCAITADGERLAYDALVVAVGARAGPAPPGAIAFAGPHDVPALSDVLDAAERGELGRLAFAVSPGVAWTLPVYELAIMAAVDLRDRGAGAVRITVVTPEEAPLRLFGTAASEAVTGLLRARGIELVTGHVRAVTPGRLELADGTSLVADAAVALPPLRGPWIGGLPADEHGFIPVDPHGRVRDAPGVYAAGDATSFPIKQGGLATQQADAVAASVAADLGGQPAALPFRPVLRGLLLTGGAPLYLRAELHGKEPHGHSKIVPRALQSDVSTRALWWPPGKVAGRYLAPYLATARPVALGSEPLVDRVATTTRDSAPDSEDALELVLMLAEEDARAGDYAQALHALDAAAALRGGILPARAAEQQTRWRAALTRKV